MNEFYLPAVLTELIRIGRTDDGYEDVDDENASGKLM
jgi:hypothetical protein